MAYTAYASYSIWFTDRDEYDFAIAAVGGNNVTGGVFIGSPLQAAAFFDIPFPGPAYGEGPKGFIFYFPYTPGAQIMHPGPSGIFLDEGIASYNVPGQPANPPITGQGQDMTLLWSGGIIMANGVVNDSDDPTPIPRRRWIGGIQNTPLMEGGFAFAAGEGTGCRQSARTMDGMGIGIRGQTSSTWTRRVSEYITGFTTRSSWERFYLRPRVAGTSTNMIAHYHNSAGALTGAGLRFEVGSLDLSVVTVTNLGTHTIVGTVPLTANDFARIDVLLNYPANGAESGRIRVYKNGVLSVDFTDSSGGALDTVGFHNETELGRPQQFGGTDNVIEYDICDWMNADIPNKLGVESLDSIDWHLGSHMVPHYCTSVSAPNFTPAGAGLLINQGRLGSPLSVNSVLNSTTANATITGTTDLLDIDSGVQPVCTGLTIGPVAAIIGVRSSNSLSTDGQLGYSFAGGGFVMATINEVNTGQAFTVMYNPSGMILPTPLEPFLIRYQKSNDAANAAVAGLVCLVEYIGVYGPEDNEDFVLEFPPDFKHNCRYTNSFWGLAGKVPDAPVYAVGGTYVGNGTAQTINLPAPCHYLTIRALTGGTTGMNWFGAGVNGHPGVAERVISNFPAMVYTDPVTGQTSFTVTGTNAENNASGVTYQYIAFCDPGMRFNYCGAYNINPTGQVGPRTQLLADTSFLAEWGFVQGEELSTSNVVEFMAKGPGNTGSVGQEMDGGLRNNFGTFGVGVFNPSFDAFHSTNSQTNFSLWRQNDPNCGFTMLQIGTYTGNGAGGTRVITYPVVTGRFPLFVIVQPVSASPAFFRDPSHTGANSAQFGNLANSTTAIVAGAIDSFSVGTTLNVNGVVYNYFVILGSATSWANGEFFPPNCLPPETPWVDPPLDPPEIAVLANGGLNFNGQVAFTLLKDVTGIYTLVPGKTDDTLYDRQTGQTSVDRKIPDPLFKTGYIGG